MDVQRPVEKAQEALQEIAGYLNFSSGTSDAKFLRNLNAEFRQIEAQGIGAAEPARSLRRLLEERLARLRTSSPAFRDTDQVDAVIAATYDHVLPAYRAHHHDLLFHLSDAELLRPYFLGRVFEAVLRQGPPWTEHERIVAGALAQLNDFLGHRPVAVLETEQRIEAYPHERIRPIPWYVEGAGVAVGKYHDVIERALALLRATDRELLDAAWFDPALLAELAVDPRAYDFNHPVNKRPNYHFGQWDPHHIDDKGHYRRFVLVQTTLDALCEWFDPRPDGPRQPPATEADREELLVESAAVLAGTILMASGSSGSGPDTHDSSITLTTLLPRIAAYRDAFYTQLIERMSGPHGERLRAEAAQMRQPFAAVRQHLNHALARRRAQQLQNVHLALVYARLGQAAAAERVARAVHAASARMTCEIYCHLAEARRAAAHGQLSEALSALKKSVGLVHRAIECGALVDPWNILGFDANFSLFPSPENSVHDHRVDEFLDLMEDLFRQYAHVWAAAAAVDDKSAQQRASKEFQEVATWFDRFAVPMVSSVKRVSGSESHAAAEMVADALKAWHMAGTAAGDLAFWQPLAEHFDSYKAYSAAVEALLERHDYLAAMGVLVHWSGHFDRVRLGDGDHGFHALSVRWLGGLLTNKTASEIKENERQFALVRKFFDFLESNADEFWHTPQLELDGKGAIVESGPQREDDEEAEVDADELDLDAEEDDGDNLFRAAYEDVVYRDSTDDGFEGAMMEGGGAPTNYELEREAQRLGRRLDFLSALNQLWTVAARAFGVKTDSERGIVPFFSQGTGVVGGEDARVTGGDDAGAKSGQPPSDLAPSVLEHSLRAWLEQATTQRRQLADLLRAVYRQALPEPAGNVDALTEYDRRRIIREGLLDRLVHLCVANWDATRAICSGLSAADLPDATAAQNPLPPETMRLWLAVVQGDAAAARQTWPDFLVAIRRLPLLYLPLPRGADPQRIVSVRVLLHLVRDLLRGLPRLGLMRETCQLVAAARQMEQDHPVGPGAVSEFDRLFEAAYKALIEALSQAIPPAPMSSESVPDHLTPDGAAAELLKAVQQLSESLVPQWLAHNRLLRLSVLERVMADREWHPLVAFIERYGRDVFTQKFLHLGNLRAILHQGVEAWLEKLQADPDRENEWRLLADLDKTLPREEAVQHLTMVFEAIVENYDVYRDYNTTTTQSDRGDLLYTLLDFLRVKARYERAHWNLKPVVMAHETLLRLGRDMAAQLWREAMLERSQEAAQSYLDRLNVVEKQHGFRLSSISQRIGERLVRPLVIDRLKKLAREAAAQSQSTGAAGSIQENQLEASGASPAFERLEKEASALAAQPSGSGLDLPDWLDALAYEVSKGTSAAPPDAASDPVAAIPWSPLAWPDIQQQLASWERLSLKGDAEK